ncbi:hypothetical protein QVD17_11767 [Tagetes erecta]|uniref:Uncharacterized protein n=1 Tax=Tagetes erecta TaxID=13708 RepID=A0AAD8KU30_TARER|nr:hypothetical protein QVD17_11767 [Tagetes erecta]
MAGDEGFCKDQPWRVLEFYSGIGGMRYSVMQAGVNATMIEAFDINDLANDVYKHNFGHRLFQKQSADARASSFLNILEIIPQLMQPPVMLFVENVVGFETSDTHQKMIRILDESQFVTQEFILSPLQFGVPYSRPRYFCLAKRKPSSFCRPEFNGQLICVPKPLFGDKESTLISENDQLISTSNDMQQTCLPIERFLEFGKCMDQDTFSNKDSLNQYFVLSSLIERWGSAMGILDNVSLLSYTFTALKLEKGIMGELIGLGNESKSKHVIFWNRSGLIESKDFCVQKFIVFINNQFVSND